jgi:hypothetical protein
MSQNDKSSYTPSFKPRTQNSMYQEKKLNERLYKIHLDCAFTLHNNWQLIQSSIDDKLQRQMKEIP